MDDPAPTHGLWADLAHPGIAPLEADFSIIGIPYDGAACARKGAALGPERIRFWSHHTAPFSEDRTRLHAIRISDLGDISIRDPEHDFNAVWERVATLPNAPILLGGDHSVTIPIFQGQRERFRGEKLGVLWVDAHPDLCDIYTGTKYSHACVLRRGLEFGIEPEDVCLVGLRSWEEQEIELIESGKLNVYTASQVAERRLKAVAAEV